MRAEGGFSQTSVNNVIGVGRKENAGFTSFQTPKQVELISGAKW